MTQYFIHDGQTEKGPFNLEQIKLESLQKETPIWYQGLENWTTADQIEELKPLFAQKATPPPLYKPTLPSIPVYSKPEAPTPGLPPDIDERKKNLTAPLLIAGAILLTSFFGWLIYQNQTQAETLTEVQQQVTQQDQQITQQQQQVQQRVQEDLQKDQQRLIDEQNARTAKDEVNAALTQKYMSYRNNWSNYFTATHNQYLYSEVGGISNLEVIVYNQTDKLVDEIQVRVDYIKANGGTYKFETVSVTNIGPESQKSVSAPNSDRGTSVRMEIQSISAPSIHFCYPFGMPGNKDSDPYFCK